MTSDPNDIDATPEEKTKVWQIRGGLQFALSRGPDGLWRDTFGTVIALTESTWSVDKETRAGVGIFSFPESWVITYLAAPHDYAYSSPAVQTFISRSEIDSQLVRVVHVFYKNTFPGLSEVVAFAVSEFGPQFWEVAATRGERRAPDSEYDPSGGNDV